MLETVSCFFIVDTILEPVFIHITLSKLDQGQPSTSNDKEKFKIVSLTKVQVSNDNHEMRNYGSIIVPLSIAFLNFLTLTP